MRVITNFNPQRLPLMTDLYVEMLAIAIVLGISEKDFEEIYFNNLAKFDKVGSEITIVQVVKEYVDIVIPNIMFKSVNN